MTRADEVFGTRRVTGEPEAAVRIVEACGLLPLAVRITGTRLAGRPHWSLAHLADCLHNSRSPLDEFRVGNLNLRTSIDRSFQRLSGITRLALLRLATADTDSFSPGTVAAMLGIDEFDAEQITEALVDLRLLELADFDEFGRFNYRVHRLVRLFAQERLHVATPTPSAGATLIPRPRPGHHPAAHALGDVSLSGPAPGPVPAHYTY